MKNIFIKIILFNILILYSNNYLYGKNPTTITTDGGIKIFQNEKYYDLRDNVFIESKNFKLNSDNVLAYYDKDFYDITKIIATGNTKLVTKDGAVIMGEKVIYDIIKEEFSITGNGSFKNERLTVIATEIDGSFIKVDDENQIKNVFARDDETVFINNNEMKSYSKSAIYAKKNEVLELFDDVKIIKNQEVTTGDYANINMINNNYTIKSKKGKKVKLLINSEE